MFFEAKLKNRKYDIHVEEMRNSWTISIKEEDSEPVNYDIPKADFMSMDDAFCFLYNNDSYMVDIVGSHNEYTVYTRCSYRTVNIYNDEMILHESIRKGGTLGGESELTAGMPGKIVKVMVKEGDEIKANQPLLIMEAMKMENEMRASEDVKIAKVLVKPGDSIESGATLIVFKK